MKMEYNLFAFIASSIRATDEDSWIPDPKLHNKANALSLSMFIT